MMIENWTREMWKLTSIRLGLLASMFIGWIAAYPQDWQNVVDQLPPPVRPLVGFAAFAAITWSRMSKQGANNA